MEKETKSNEQRLEDWNKYSHRQFESNLDKEDAERR